MKSYRNILVALLAVISIASSANAQSQLPNHTDTIAAIAMESCPDTYGCYDYYICTEIQKDPVVGKTAMSGAYRLMFVDMNPTANWDHECAYVYIKEGATLAEKEVKVVKAKHPPYGIDLKPYRVRQNGSQTALKKASSRMAKARATSNYSASHTYAVIISGGANPVDNMLRYWNDCSFIYDALTNTHGIPRENVKVLMAGGKSDEGTINWGTTFSPDLRRMECDFDDDGNDEVDYPATIQSLDNVFGELKAKLHEGDHLFVFVTDHGGSDEITDSAFIYLWNNYRLSPKAFAKYFEGMDAGYISFVLGQCYSGGFVDDLAGDNRIVMAACGKDQKSYGHEKYPFDEFLYHFTSAINGSDPYGNVVNAGKDGVTTLRQAYEYAVKADYHAHHKIEAFRETPMLSILENTTAEELAMNRIPAVVDLCIGEFPYAENETFWESPAIWARYVDDGLWRKEHEIRKSDKARYGYVTVCNRGVRQYKGKGMWANMYWVKPFVNAPANCWLTSNVDYKCLGSREISDVIRPCESKTIKMAASNDAMGSFANPSLFSTYTYFADLSSKESLAYRPTYIPYEDLPESTRKWMACKNVITMDSNDNYAYVYTPAGKKTSYRIELYEDMCNTKSMYENAHIFMKFPDVADISSNGMELSENSTIDRNNPQRICISGNSSVTGVSSSIGKYSMSCAFRANDAITEKTIYKLNTAIYDELSGKCVGGMTYEVTSKPRPAITVDVNYVKQGNVYYFLAENASESVTYEWFDGRGNSLGEYDNVPAPINSVEGVRLRVTAKSDGAFADFDCLPGTLIQPFVRLEKVQEGYNVMFNEPVLTETVVTLTTLGNASSTKTYTVKKGESQVFVNTGDSASRHDTYLNLSIRQEDKTIGTFKLQNN